MSINFHVLFKKNLEIEDIPNFNSEGDDSPLAFLDYICEKLDDDGACEFRISGFGEELWPVDVHTDLSVFLEQIPFAIKAVEEQSAFVIDFYEQGLERKLLFSPAGIKWSVKCEHTYDDDTQFPEIVSIDEEELKPMLEEVKTNFLNCVEPIKSGSSSWSKVISDWENRNF